MWEASWLASEAIGKDGWLTCGAGGPSFRPVAGGVTGVTGRLDRDSPGSWTGSVGKDRASWQARGTEGEAGLLAGGVNGEAAWTADKAEDEECLAI